MNFNRRSLLVGVGALIAAPAIVRASSLMPVRQPLGSVRAFSEKEIVEKFLKMQAAHRKMDELIIECMDTTAEFLYPGREVLGLRS